MKIVLASESKSRQELLSYLCVDFTIQPSHIDETPLPSESALDLCRRLAREKALVHKDLTDALIIGSDIVGCLDGVLYGKPLCYDTTLETFLTFSGKCVEYYCGLCVLNTNTQEIIQHAESSKVFFKKLGKQDIINYLAVDQPFHCAGGLNLQGFGITLIEKVECADYFSILGLPLVKLWDILQKETHL